MKRDLPAVALLNTGKVLVVGGCRGTSAEVYDPDTGTFAATGSMNEEHVSPAAIALSNGKVLVAGDGNQTNDISAELYQ